MQPSVLLQNFLIILAVMAVAIADVFIKRAAQTSSYAQALLSPWMLGALGLYLFQIAFFLYVFVSGGKLITVGNLQTIFYALTILVAGLLWFKESLTWVQGVGIAFALVGVFLINSR